MSVVIPTKNRAALLRQALASVRAIEGPDLDLQIIVVDKGSTDDTAAVATQCGVRLVVAPVAGAAAARNAGLTAATGHFIAFLDDDDVWLPGHLRQHVRMLKQHPELAAVVGQIVSADWDLRPTTYPWPRPLPADGKVFPAFFRSYPQIGATVVRATVRQTVGRFDERLFGGQDWDWHLRLALKHRIGFVGVLCILFREHPKGVRDDLQWRRFFFWRRVFFTSLWRARHRMPPIRTVAKAYLWQTGSFYRYFLASALRHDQTGDRAQARRCLRRAVLSSPIHTARDVVRGSDVISLVTRLVPPR